jgi:sterol desaturase/sphingolipid hydroxylase (fatty acid hydroxylase superfamily)
MAILSALLIEIVRLTVWLVILAVIFVPLERLFALRPRELTRRALWPDLLFFLSSLVPAVLIAAPMAMMAALTHHLLPSAWTAGIADLPVGLRLLLVFVIGEIGFYWGHRWSHQSAWLWQFHQIHHRPQGLDWLINTRAHPVDMVFTRLCGLIPIYLTGLVQPDVPGSLGVILVVLAGTIWGFFIHANIRCSLGPLEHFLASPRFHHWHHVRIGPLNRNYASMLPVLDQLFGTLHLPRQTWPDTYGIDENLAIGSPNPTQITRGPSVSPGHP